MAGTVLADFKSHSFPDKTVNMDRWDSIIPWWLSERPYVTRSPDMIVGPLVSAQPTTVEHWAIQGAGVCQPVSAFDKAFSMMVRL